MNEYNRPPTRMYVSSSCSIFVLTICSRVVRCWSEDSGRRRGIRSNINGFRERFTSRKILCVSPPPHSHSCRSQRLLDTGEDGPKLRQNIIVFPRCSLDASVRRQAQGIEVEALRYRLAEGGAGKFVMNCWIPVEVGMQKRP